MAGELSTFNPDSVKIVWALPSGGLILHEGLIDAPGAMSETKDGMRSTRRRDRQNNGVRNIRNGTGGTMTLIYVAEAQIQGVLTTIIEIDNRLFSQVGAIVVTDLNTNSVITYFGAHIEDDPAISFGDTAADRPYVWGYQDRTALLAGQDGV